MTIPRMSVDALAAQAKLEPSRLIVLVEGQSDRTVLECIVDSDGLPVDVYFIGDIEVKYFGKYSEYGGNKARVASAIESLSDMSDKNLVGVVDLDNDDLLAKNISLKGLYYTKFCCLLSLVFSKDALHRLIKVISQKDVQDFHIYNIMHVCKDLFFVRSLRDLINPLSSLPKIRRYVNRAAPFGFELDSYITALTNALRSSFTSHDIEEIIGACREDRVDVRSQMHFHTAVELLCFYLKEFRIINRLIETIEMEVEMRLAYILDHESCNVISLIRRKAEDLV